MMRSSILLTCFYLLSIATVKAQTAIGQWRTHLSYNATIAVAETKTKMYAVSKDAVYYYDKTEGEVRGLSKVNGLSDFGITAMNSNPLNDIVLIGYTSANMDMIKNGKIINLSDIKRKTILGDKTIYHINFVGRLAYVSCGFGIVVIDTEREEVKDTYYIGAGGTNLTVYGTASDGTYLFAAAKDGVYRALINDPFIVNASNWTKIFSSNTIGPFNLIGAIGSKIVVNHQLSGGDSLWYYYNNAWIASNPGYFNRSIYASGNQLITTNFSSILFYDTNMVFQTFLDGSTIPKILPNKALLDKDSVLWIADEFQGMTEYKSPTDFKFIFPNGPKSAKTAIIKIKNDDLYVGHAIRNNNWQPTYSQNGFSNFTGGTWKTIDGIAPNDPGLRVGDIWDLVTTAIDPANSKHAYFGSWGKGLLETNNGNIFNYNAANSVLEGNQFGAVRVGGLDFDSYGNLWMTNSEKDSCIRVKRTNGTWKSYKSKFVDPSSIVIDLLVDDNNQKWINFYRKGLLVFNDNNTADNLADDKWKFLTDVAGNGNLSSPSVFCMTKDKDGQIWCGTEKGVCVFYSPNSVFQNSGFDAQKVLILQDGYYQYLLEKEFVQAIAVDGANRKWIGTQAGGVFLMSADGTKQLLNFNENNSPLISNNINSIEVNDVTGEVFFGTALGICSYRGDAVEGEAGCKDVTVFPNPVRQDYDGPIAIKGLVNDGQVKITDVSGHIVYETKAFGGQAIWDGKNFDGKRAQTGVYLVFCSDDEGTNTCTTKLLLAGKK